MLVGVGVPVAWQPMGYGRPLRYGGEASRWLDAPPSMEVDGGAVYQKQIAPT